MLSELIHHILPLTKAEVQKELQLHCSFKDDIEIIGRIAKKDRRIVVPALLQDKALDQMNLQHIGIENARLLAIEPIYWVGMNSDIQERIKNCPICIGFQAT